MRWKSLEKWGLAGFAAVILGIVVVSRMSVLKFEKTFIGLMERRLAVTSRCMAAGIRVMLSDSLDDLMAVVDDPTVRDFVAGTGPEPVIGGLYRRHPQYVSFGFFDAAGRYLSSGGAMGDAAGEVKTVLATRQPLLGSVVRDPGDGGAAVSLCIPVEEDGKIIGVARGIISVRRAFSVFEPEGPAEDWILYVIDRSGKYVYHPEMARMSEDVLGYLQKKAPDFDWSEAQDLVGRMTSGGEGAMVHRTTFGLGLADVRPLRKMVAFTPLSFAGGFWSVAAAIDYDASIRPIKEYSQNMFITAEFLILIFFAGGFALFKTQNKAMELGLEVRLKERTQSIERLAHIGRFSADVAHQVNNPLMIISGRAQLSLLSDVPPEESKENLKVIVEQCERAKVIIRDLLLFSRPEPGERESADLNEIVAWACDTVAYQFRADGILVKRDLAAGLLLVTVVKKQMADVLLNLLVNAREALPGPGVIEVATARDDGRIRLDIRDPGRGMNEAVLKRAFDPFYTTKETGTGLGLSIVYGIVQAHGGEIKLLSAPGTGTTVSVWLPGKV